MLSDGNITLRRPRSSDAAEVAAGCQDPLIQQYTQVPVPYGIDDARVFIHSKVTDSGWWAEPTWFITDGADQWLGTVSLRPDGAGSAEIGYMVQAGHRGRGLATAAVRLVCTWALRQWGLEVITWRAAVGNDASAAVAKSVGFRIITPVLRLGIAGRDGRQDAWFADLTHSDLQRANSRRAGEWSAGLTARESQVLAAMADGSSNRAIASRLGIRENTVKNHVRSILEKLQARSRTEAVAKGWNERLLEQP